MDQASKVEIASLLKSVIYKKIKSYESETTYMPFFEAIFGKEVIINASIMQSLYTSFGMSVYEQISVFLAKSAGFEASRQYRLLGTIDKKTESLIDDICNGIHGAPNKTLEIELIRKSTVNGDASVDPESVVDVAVIYPDGSELFVDITTVKPNLKEFRALRKKMLRWCALRFSQDSRAVVRTCIGIPYNPYYPAPYERWTGGVCDPHGDLLVQNDLWKAFANKDVFDELVDLFKDVGTEVSAEIGIFLNNKA